MVATGASTLGCESSCVFSVGLGLSDAVCDVFASDESGLQARLCGRENLRFGQSGCLRVVRCAGLLLCLGDGVGVNLGLEFLLVAGEDGLELSAEFGPKRGNCVSDVLCHCCTSFLFVLSRGGCGFFRCPLCGLVHLLDKFGAFAAGVDNEVHAILDVLVDTSDGSELIDIRPEVDAQRSVRSNLFDPLAPRLEHVDLANETDACFVHSIFCERCPHGEWVSLSIGEAIVGDEATSALLESVSAIPFEDLFGPFPGASATGSNEDRAPAPLNAGSYRH